MNHTTNQNRKHKIFTTFLQGLILFSILTFWGMSWYNSDWSTYGVNLLARSKEFLHYFVAQSAAHHITPQFFTDYLLLALIKLGFSYPFATLFWFLTSCLILIIGTLFLSKAISKKYFFSCAIIVLVYIVFNSISAPVSGNLLWANSLLHSSFASTFCIWSLYFMLKEQKRFYLSYVLCVCASFIQIQVGFYFGIILIIYQFLYSIRNKKAFNFYSVCIWLLPTILLILVFKEQSDSLLSNASFVNIYARLRHPYHMIPSSWSVQGYINFGMFLLSIFYFAYKKLYVVGKYQDILYWLFAICFLCIVALCFNYIFTDIYPWALIVKIQPARMVTMCLLSLSVIIVCLVDQCMDEHEYLPIIGFAFLLFLNYIYPIDFGIWFFICTFSYVCLQKSVAYPYLYKLESCIPKLLFPLSIGFLVTIAFYRLSYSLIFTSFALCILYVLFTPTLKWRFHTAIYLLPLLSYTITMTTIPNFFSQNINNALYILSLRFQAKTPSDTIYYADPKGSGLEAVTLFARRSPVVFEKNVPIYDNAILEWLNRLIAFGVVKNHKGKYEYIESQLSANETITMAKKYGASFLIMHQHDLQTYVNTRRVSIFDFEDKFYILSIVE